MHWKNIRVLLVEPDDSFAARTERAFQKSNDLAVLTRAHTLAEARAKLAASTHDVIISGFRLPDGPATELVTSPSESDGLPVVVLVRREETDEAGASLEAGAVECFIRDGRSLNGLPRAAARAVREWHHRVEKSRTEQIIAQLRSQVLRFRGMATSGLIERDVARDLVDVLSPVLGYAQAALENIPESGATQKEIEQVARIARLSKELIRDAVNGNGGQSTVELAGVIRDVIDLVYPVKPDGVEIRIAKAPGAIGVEASTLQLYKVFLNLYTNAFDAMRTSGGILHVGVDVDEREPDDFVRITVTDTGHGMSPDVARRAFDPLFTTKNGGTGRGAGLCQTREIVQDHGGTITLESEPGKGTVLQLMLPQTQTSIAPGRPRDSRRTGAAI